MPVLLGVLGFLLLIVLWVVAIYNGLVRTRNMVDESWSDIDTEMKRRYELIPNLVETVKGYAAHERQTLESVISARNVAAANHGTPSSQARDENALMGTLRQLMVVVERYPELKANQNFLRLQEELSVTEDRIQRSRRFYNGNVRDLNNRIGVFPGNMVAGSFGFTPREFFELEDPAMRQAPKVSFTS